MAKAVGHAHMNLQSDHGLKRSLQPSNIKHSNTWSHFHAVACCGGLSFHTMLIVTCSQPEAQQKTHVMCAADGWLDREICKGPVQVAWRTEVPACRSLDTAARTLLPCVCVLCTIGPSHVSAVLRPVGCFPQPLLVISMQWHTQTLSPSKTSLAGSATRPL